VVDLLRELTQVADDIRNDAYKAEDIDGHNDLIGHAARIDEIIGNIYNLEKGRQAKGHLAWTYDDNGDVKDIVVLDQVAMVARSTTSVRVNLKNVDKSRVVNFMTESQAKEFTHAIFDRLRRKP